MNQAVPPGSTQGASPRWIPVLLGIALLVMLGVRCGLSITLPLADTTEARYGEIVRVGLVQGYWLMPHAAPGEPFFAKPPGSTWLSMASASLFGLSEASLRLPSLLLMLATVFLCLNLLRRASPAPRQAGLWTALILLGSPLGFVLAGAVMTDALHVFAVTLAMVGATGVVFATDRGDRRARTVFWAAIGLGALAKGLATWVLACLPIALYALWTRQPWGIARRFIAPAPMLLAAVIALPWFLTAEVFYPGFLKYFIVGEHLQRFLEPGWQGDRYGTAHRQPIGMIWAYAVGALGPWVLPVVIDVWLRRRRPLPDGERMRSAATVEAAWWICWMLAPCLLFTFARNIIWTYAATALPAAALWIGIRMAATRRPAWMAIGAAVWSLVAVFAIPTVQAQAERQSARALLAVAKRIDPEGRLPLAVHSRLRFSAGFYSDGRACIVSDSASEQACEAASGGKGLRVLDLPTAQTWVQAGSAELLATEGRFALVLRPSRSESRP